MREKVNEVLQFFQKDYVKGNIKYRINANISYATFEHYCAGREGHGGIFVLQKFDKNFNRFVDILPKNWGVRRKYMEMLAEIFYLASTHKALRWIGADPTRNNYKNIIYWLRGDIIENALPFGKTKGSYPQNNYPLHRALENYRAAVKEKYTLDKHIMGVDGTAVNVQYVVRQVEKERFDYLYEEFKNFQKTLKKPVAKKAKKLTEKVIVETMRELGIIR